ncbi:hypothetical protein W97_02839 [Coniosporium apollinis CBS 100218]|uniref:HTH La-type RNA-binding domain-containing protein n=1 Tax=Coniosporium apollinis (strain CBS 100218) TaxID=1168221 RepID=R7YPQ2_CONA1|nr:uncharacterized protein W97_02839 [Coniosporium apollinis CBS 100218]EON63611.1 hypothetical protein W97_02839 [Coniosporium apollinis CBS 100218]
METEVADTDPAATSLENDQTVANQAGNMEEQGQSAETVEAAGAAPVETVMPETGGAKGGEPTKADDAPTANGDSKTEKPEERTRRNGDDRERKPFSRPQRNVKTDFSALAESSDPDEIRKQARHLTLSPHRTSSVEFYFSDSNLIQDKFLLDLVGGHENRAVPIKVIHSFKRMRHFQPYSAVVAALRDSSILDVTADDELRRKTPLPEEVGKDIDDEKIKIFEDKAMPRSIYAKGFGEEGPSTQFDIEAFFMPYGPTNQIRLRRTWQDKTFKGSVFVEFDSEDTQKAFLALDPKPKFQGRELKIMSKREYVEGKTEDIRAGKIQASERPQFNGRGRGRGGRGRGDRNDRNDKRRDRSRSPRGDRDDKDWRGRREDFQKSKDFKGRGGGRGGRGRDNRDRRDRRDDDRQGKRRRDDAEDKGEQKEDNSETKKAKMDEAAPAAKSDNAEPAKGAEVPPEVAKPAEKPAAVQDGVTTGAAAS